jgi:DNA-binding IclR family transcriptional regulator
VTDAELPPDLRAFLYSCVDAVEQAEIVIRLHASEGAFTARTLARDLGVPDTAARHHLETLVARGLLQTAVGGDVFYRFAPKTPELQRFCETLVEWWGHSRSAVLRFIATNPRSSMRSFANAFRLGRGE